MTATVRHTPHTRPPLPPFLSGLRQGLMSRYAHRRPTRDALPREPPRTQPAHEHARTHRSSGATVPLAGARAPFLCDLSLNTGLSVDGLGRGRAQPLLERSGWVEGVDGPPARGERRPRSTRAPLAHPCG